MCLRFVFLLITRLAAWLRLSRREETWKTAEILILRHQLAVLQRRQPRRPKLNWADRALLAALFSVIPKARRHGLRLLVTPDTMVRRHRDIIRHRRAARSMCGKTGRPATRQTIRALALRLARENPEWGYRRSTGNWPAWECESRRRPYGRSSRTPESIPRRTGPTWPQFRRSQADAILACDFFTVDLLDGTQAYVLAVIEHATRRIRILGVTLHPTGEWTTQQARNLLMDLGEQTQRVTFMIRDRGSSFTAAFDAVLAGAGIRTVLCNVRTPRMNAVAERWSRGMPPRAPGPHPDLEPAPSAADPARLRDPPQPASAAPLAARRRAADTADRTGRSGAVPRPKTHSRRWPDQRISPGRMTWTRFSARTGLSCGVPKVCLACELQPCATGQR
jgi:putative transposase